MLIKLLVDNFLSFENESELSMVTSNKIQKMSDHKINIKGASVLKHAVIYGANAAGKSNLIEAFKFIKYCVRKTIPANATTMFCKTKESNSTRPSTFEITFTCEDKVFAYGFSVILQERKITAEWMYELHQNGSAKTLFERQNGEKPQLGDRLALDKLDTSKMDTYLEDFDESSSMLFLSFMNKEKKYSSSTKLSFFQAVYNWIDESLDVFTPQSTITDFEYYYDEASLSQINKLIRTFDTGITDITIESISQEEMKKEVPDKIFNDIIEKISKKIEDDSSEKVRISMRSNTSFFNVELLENGEVKVTTIKLKHGKSFYDFAFREESEGTRRLFELLDILFNKAQNKVYVIDEMERSLHPKLTSRFIELFNQMHLEQKIQLIFTTHEASIMDQDLFRRDEIWFVERNKDNQSTIYSLDKFKERYDRVLSKSYLEGRYGAIPIFSSFDFKEEIYARRNQINCK